MKLTVIGYWGAFPKANEASSGYLLQTDKHNILIDCGSGILSKLQNYISITKIDAIILSHYHADHFADIGPFQYEASLNLGLNIRKKPLEIYGHEFDSKFFSLNFKKGTVGKKIDDTVNLDFDGLEVRFKWVKHAVPCLSMRFEYNGKVIAYSGDTELCDNIFEISKNADLFICETSLFNKQKGLIKGHLTASQVGKIATKANVKEVMLTHFPHYGDLNLLKKECEEEFKGNIYMAEEGLKFQL